MVVTFFKFFIIMLGILIIFKISSVVNFWHVEMEKETIFLLSNGSVDCYPSNTLTKFRNLFPYKFETNSKRKYEVSLDAIGISNTYRNISLPENPSIPSVIVSNLRRVNHLQKYNVKFEANEDGNGCQFQYFFMEDKYYTKKEIEKFFSRVNENSQLTNMSFENGQINIKSNGTLTNGHFVFVHESFRNSFGLPSYDEFKEFYEEIDKEDYDYDGYISNFEKSYYIRRGDKYLLNSAAAITKQSFKGELYYGYYMRVPAHVVYGLRDVLSVKLPKLIKVKCPSIDQQVFNSEFSKDLMCFTPAITNGNYIYHEFTSKQFCTISNTCLNDIAISICDENNRRLDLLPGISTILKLSLKKMGALDDTFNVRLTSEKSERNYKNENNNFRVVLPETLKLSRQWKTALSSISFPGQFTTFLKERYQERTIKYEIREITSIKTENENGEKTIGPPIETRRVTYEHTLQSDQCYTEETLVNEMNSFLSQKRIGRLEIDVDTKKYKFVVTSNPFNAYAGKLYLQVSIGIDLAFVLGMTNEEEARETNSYQGVELSNTITKFLTYEFSDEQIREKSVDIFCSRFIDVDYFKPKYMMVYANFVSPSIVGGKYLNLLKVIPLTEQKTSMVLKEFKSKDFYEILYTDIKEIEIQLRSHDGELLNFLSPHDVLVNIEFSTK